MLNSAHIRLCWIQLTSNSAEFSWHQTLRNSAHIRLCWIQLTSNTAKFSSHQTMLSSAHIKPFWIQLRSNYAEFSSHQTLRSSAYIKLCGIQLTSNSAELRSHQTLQKTAHIKLCGSRLVQRGSAVDYKQLPLFHHRLGVLPNRLVQNSPHWKEVRHTLNWVNKTPDHRIVSTDRSIQTLLYWIQHLDQYTCRIHVILRPDIEPEWSGFGNQQGLSIPARPHTRA